jgi:hypothetical protein
METQGAYLPHGPERYAQRKIKQLAVAIHLYEWITSPRLRPPSELSTIGLRSKSRPKYSMYSKPCKRYSGSRSRASKDNLPKCSSISSLERNGWGRPEMRTGNAESGYLAEVHVKAAVDRAFGTGGDVSESKRRLASKV